MATLASTTDPDVLVPGSEASARGDAGALRARSEQLDTAADELARVRVGTWSGPSADGFWLAMNAQPKSWRTTADALTAAAAKLETYAGVLAGAKTDAAGAIELWAAAAASTAASVRTHDAAVADFGRSLGTAQSLMLPLAYVDSGAETRRQAVELLDAALAAVRRAGDDAADVLGEIVISDSAIVHNEAGWKGPDASASTSGAVFKIDPLTGKLKLDLAKVEAEASLFSADASTEAKYGSAFATAQAGVLLGAKASASAGVGEGTVQAKAEASAGVHADASARAGLEHLNAGVSASGLAGAYAEAGVEIGKNGADAKLGGFAGAKGEVGADIDIAGIGGEVKAEGWAGIGVEAEIGLTSDHDGVWTLIVKAGAAVGLGGSGSAALTIDPEAVLDAANDAADFFTGRSY